MTCEGRGATHLYALRGVSVKGSQEEVRALERLPCLFLSKIIKFLLLTKTVVFFTAEGTHPLTRTETRISHDTQASRSSPAAHSHRVWGMLCYALRAARVALRCCEIAVEGYVAAH